MAQVRVKRGRNAYVLDVVNISESGALVDLGSLARPFWLSNGRRVELILFTPVEGADFAPLGLWADIVRVFEHAGSIHFGVSFVDAKGDIAASVSRLIEEAPRPPPLPARHYI